MSELINSVKDQLGALPTWAKAAVGVVAVGGPSFLILKAINCGRKSPYKKDYKPDVVYLYDFPRCAAMPTLSPYSMKLETWLRMANVNYENVPNCPLWIKSKEGMMPFVELNGVEYDDSSFIIRDLTKLLKKDTDGALSVEQKAVSRAFEQMVDNSTMVSFAYIRCTEHLKDYFSEQVLGTRLPFWFHFMYPLWWIRREGLKRLWCHGIGRHPPNEIIGIGLDDLKSISAYLSTKQYFHGDTPTRVDAVLFGYLAQILYFPTDSPHKKVMNTECRNLVRFCDRMKVRYWPDWEEICKTRKPNTWKK